MNTLRDRLMHMDGGWVLEVDIRKFFDTVDHKQMQEFVRRRVQDGVILRLIGKWLNAGVLEQGSVSYPERGTPQGGVISPLLANLYLHEVLDTWWERDVKPRLKGAAHLVRYADDFVLVFEDETDAKRVQAVLPKRFEKFGLQVHPEKTRLVRFESPGRGNHPPGQFDLLGFTWLWERSRRGNWVIRCLTASSRFRRGLQRLVLWCQAHRHDPIRVQQQGLRIRLRGHYAYYGVTGNWRRLDAFRYQAMVAWKQVLTRRSQRAHMTWVRFLELLKRFPLPAPTIVHSIFRSAAHA
jgi:group II intron reverse transcriptase/maturase